MARLVLCSLVSTAVACGSVALNEDAATPTVSITSSGGGKGTITSTPGGIDCGTDCAESFAPGTSVVLTATPDADSTFIGWTGGGCTGTDPCTVTVTGDLAVQAEFATNSLLTVTKSVTGMGTVSSSPAGIDCGEDCMERYAPGTMVTLTAAPMTGSAFAGWSGACTGSGECVVTMNGAMSVTASFAPCTNQTVTLTAVDSVSIAYPNAAGTVYRDNNTRAYNSPTGDCGGGPPCDITGWIEFNLSSIPDTAVVTAMTLRAYADTVQMGPTVRVQYSNGNNWARATVTQANLPRTNVEVGGAVAPALNAYTAFPIAIGSQNWSADLADNSLTLGLDNTNTAYSYAYFQGSDVAANRPTLQVTYCNGAATAQ